MRTSTPKLNQDSRGYWRVSYYQDNKRKYEYFGTGGRGREIAQKFLADKTQDLYREDLGMVKEISAEEFFAEYLEYSLANKAKKTVQRDALTIGHLLPYIANKNLNEVGPQLIEKYKTDRKVSVKTSTINRDLNTIKAAFNRAVEWGYLKQTPLKSVKRYKEKKLPPRFFTHDEIRAFLRHFDNLNVKAAILLLLYTGMRRDEFMHLEWTDIDLARGRLCIQPKDNWTPKDYEFRVIPIGKQCKEVLLSLPKNGKLVFGEYTAPSSLSRTFRRALRTAGIEKACLHTLRHTYASHLVMVGVDLPTVQKLLGHSNIATTMRYAHLAPEHLESAVKKLNETFCFELEEKPADNVLLYPEKTQK